MKTDLVIRAYALDCLVTGVLSFEGERLTDFLAVGTEFELRQVVLVALDDGRVVRVPQLTISREELLAVVAEAPRGSTGRRLRTRPEAVRIGIGPFEVLGYLHAPPTADPVSTALRRVFVPLTDCSIGRREGGQFVVDRGMTLIVNRAEILWLERAVDAKLDMLRSPELPIAIDPRAKDLTGELLGMLLP